MIVCTILRGGAGCGYLGLKIPRLGLHPTSNKHELILKDEMKKSRRKTFKVQQTLTT